jgi:TonB family protein
LAATLVALLCAAAAVAQEAASAPPSATGDGAKLLDIKQCYPAYPRESIAAEETGLTRLRMYIAASGDLRGVSLVQSSGSARLDNAAIEALSRCKFKAAMQAGVPIESSFVVEYKWQFSTPAITNNCKPDYPAAALHAGEQGKTVIQFQLTSAGEAENIEVAQSSGSARLDEASIAAVRRCQFKRTRASSPQKFKVEYNWRLEDDAPAVPLGPEAPDLFRPRL